VCRGGQVVASGGRQGRVVRCFASWQLARDEDQPWPGGDWHHCPGEAVRARILPVTPEVIVVLHFCAAHDELFARAGVLPGLIAGPLHD